MSNELFLLRHIKEGYLSRTSMGRPQKPPILRQDSGNAYRGIRNNIFIKLLQHPLPFLPRSCLVKKSSDDVICMNGIFKVGIIVD